MSKESAWLVRSYEPNPILFVPQLSRVIGQPSTRTDWGPMFGMKLK